MTTKKKKQAASQQVQKSDSRTNPSKSSVRNDFSKTKHGAKVDSLVPVTKYGLGYAFVVLILGMN